MKQTKKMLIAIILMVTSAWAVPEVNLIPWPQSISLPGGEISLSGSSRVVYSDSSLSDLAQIVAQEVEEITRLQLTTIQGSPAAGDIYLKLTTDSSITDEAYRVVVDTSATAEAANYNAVAMASVTVIQAIKENAGSYSLPKMTVNDAPDAAYRGFMVDVARNDHSIDNLKEIVDMCRLYKIRYLQIHLTDDQAFTFPTTAYPDLAAYGHTYTLAEMNDLVAYADRSGVIIIPEMDVPGHGSCFAQSMPDLFGTSISATINFSDPAVWSVLDTIIGEMCAVFQSAPYVHLGADECTIVGLDQTQEFIDAINTYGVGDIHGLFNYFINHLNTTVKSHGKKTIVWEGFEYGKTGNAKMDTDIAVMMFDNYKHTDDYRNAGHQVINCSWFPLYVVGNNGFGMDADIIYQWDLMQFRNYSDPYPRRATATFSKDVTTLDNIPGGQMCSWEMPEANEIPCLRFRLAPFAERIWNKDSTVGFADFDARYDFTDLVLDYILADHQAPGVPQGVGASSDIYSDKVRVGWAEADNYPVKYALYRNTVDNSSTATLITDSLSKSTFAYDDTNVNSGQTYYYWVKAWNKWGWSSFSSAVSGKSGTGNSIASIYEPFNYTANADISGQNGGTSFSSGWNVTTAAGTAKVTSSGLTYPGLSTSGNALQLTCTGDDGFVIDRTINGTIGQDMSVVWFSFIIRADNVADGHAFVALNNGFSVGKSWVNGFGFFEDSSVQIQNGNTYFIVARYDCRSGNDIGCVWVNPSLGSEPMVENADSYYAKNDIGVGGKISFNIQGHGSGQYTYDEFRTGSSWSDVVEIGTSESEPPTPNPASFATAPYAVGSDTISMIATTGADASGIVEYYFTCTSGGGHDSAWQSSTSYTDNGLTANTTYSYTVTMRDAFSNTGTASGAASATTAVGLQSPYGGSARAIPGTIEAEDYDLGGEGLAYHDTTAGNEGGLLRTDDVDVQVCSEGGYNVGWTVSDEWLEYTVDVTSGTYDLNFRVTSPNAGTQITVKLDGVALGTVTLPNTGDWQTWQTVTLSNIAITGGSGKILRLEFSGEFNFNWFDFVAIADVIPPASPIGLAASANNATVSLDWNDNIESDFNVYNVYRSTTSGSGYQPLATAITASSYTDNTVANDITYYYVVTAEDTTGNESGYSSEVSATPQATVVQGPYGGTARALPGTIEAEDYDLGGEGLAYHDNDTGNIGGAYRSDGVDIETCGEGGYSLGWTVSGEWLEYTVDVAADIYNIDLRVATPNEGTQITVKLDGVTLGTVTLPNTGGWQTWQSVTLPEITLAAGNSQVLRLELTGEFNFNRIDFISTIQKVAVMVDSELYPEFATDIDNYVAGVEANFPVELIVLNNNYRNMTFEQIRSELQTIWQIENISGVVQIGFFPSLPFHMGSHGVAPQPIGYMDLDGTFTDEGTHSQDADGNWIYTPGTPDGYYDQHYWNDNGLEIWCSVIRPYQSSAASTDYTTDVRTQLHDFFTRTHAYYNNQLVIPRRGLAYINNDWSVDGTVLEPLFNEIYGADNTVAYYGGRNSGFNFMEERATGFEATYLYCHSASFSHDFDRGPWRAMPNTDLVPANGRGSVFTSGFNCHGADYHETPTGCMGQSYVFGCDLGQLFRGSSISFATVNSIDFSQKMRDGKHAGQAHKEVIEAFYAGLESFSSTESHNEVFGQVLIGNPFITTTASINRSAPAASISGSVIGSSEVRLTASQNGNIKGVAYSSAGAFTIDYLPAGTYDVLIETLEGADCGTHSITVSAGQNLTGWDITLPNFGANTDIWYYFHIPEFSGKIVPSDWNSPGANMSLWDGQGPAPIGFDEEALLRDGTGVSPWYSEIYVRKDITVSDLGLGQKVYVFATPASLTRDSQVPEVWVNGTSVTMELITDRTALSYWQYRGDITSLVTGGNDYITAKSWEHIDISAPVYSTEDLAVPTQSPYGGSARVIPGTIEAEDYDLGGEGLAYHDTTAGNEGGVVRTDDVDVQACSEGGYNVGWTVSDEWLEYTVDVTSGTYDLNFRVATPNAGTQITVKLDGVALGTVTLPNTGDWQTWQTVTLSNIAITGGSGKILRLEFSGEFNFNWFDFAAIADIIPPASPIGLAASADDVAVSLDWNDNTESDFDVYNVYRSTTSGSGYQPLATAITASSYTDNTVANDITYYYVVTAEDTTGNESGYSSEVSATLADVIPPALPTGLAASADDSTVSLDWNDNTESDFDVYNVYRSTTSGSGYQPLATAITASSYTDNTVANDITYYYVVTAEDTTGNESASSSEVSATPQATVVQGPYGGIVGLIPGTIEAEDYDLGGEGLAYHDNDTGNIGGAYRSDGVDIETCGEGGFNVGWTGAGEWMEYTVDVISGTYDINLRVATPNTGGQIIVKLDNVTLATINVPNTAGWQIYQTVTIPNVTVSGGIGQILTIEMTAGDSNINWIEFLSSTPTWTEIIYDDFESGLGNWTIPGTESFLYTDGIYAYDGNNAIDLQDNNNNSVCTTVDLALAGYSEIKVDFAYYCSSMDNADEDFWLQISTDGGNNFTTVEEWNLNDEFVNDQFYTDSVTITGYTLTNQTQLRFRCDASGNKDDVYIDTVMVSAQ